MASLEYGNCFYIKLRLSLLAALRAFIYKASRAVFFARGYRVFILAVYLSFNR